MGIPNPVPDPHLRQHVPAHMGAQPGMVRRSLPGRSLGPKCEIASSNGFVQGSRNESGFVRGAWDGRTDPGTVHTGAEGRTDPGTVHTGADGRTDPGTVPTPGNGPRYVPSPLDETV